MFCVIRCPYSRLISEFYHQNRAEDYNPEALNNWITQALRTYETNKNAYDNHLLDQLSFANLCQIKVCFDNLQENIDRLATLFSLPKVKLPHHPGGAVQQAKRETESARRLTRDDVSGPNLVLIEETYANDIALYEMVKSAGILIHDELQFVTA